MFQHRLLRFFGFVCAIALALGGSNASAQTAKLWNPSAAPTIGATVVTPQVRAELIAHAPEGIGSGHPVWLGLLLTHQKDWHTYWKNPGDSGLATTLDWQLPAGVSVGAIAWPVPQTLRVGPLTNYGYTDQVLLAVPLEVHAALGDANSAALDVRLHASWLACRVECIPQEGDFALRVPLRGSTAMHSALFAQQQAAVPSELPAGSSARVVGERLELTVYGLPPRARGQTLALFAEAANVLPTNPTLGADWTQAWQGDVWTAQLPLSAQRGPTLPELPLVLTLAGDVQPRPAWRTVAAVQGAWANTAPAAEVPAALAAALAANPARATSSAPSTPPNPPTPSTSPTLMPWLAALLGGLLGGLLLNLMPCVFPVLALKLLALAQHGQPLRVQRWAGAAYSLGVVLSFVLLGGLLLGLRAAGEQLGWGFQLQSPAIVVALAVLFTLLGLNLSGWFEFGQLLPSRLAALQVRHPVGEAFLSGVLAVAIASPCTAPFMGASLGLAVGLPSAQALGVFIALGVGMALPYAVVSSVPRLGRWLPRPGAWMVTLRQALAFPMFATVVWLVWVLGQQTGIDGAGALLALLVLLAAAIWVRGLQGRSRWIAASAVLLLGVAWYSALGSAMLQPAPDQPASHSAIASASPTTWQPWSAAQVDALLAQDRPVFVDFTAAWCVTCQYNKRTTLADAKVLGDFADHGVALLRADWTRRDPAITSALGALGRSGVPVYVLYAPGQAPVVLSELPSAAEIHRALRGLGRAKKSVSFTTEVFDAPHYHHS